MFLTQFLTVAVVHLFAVMSPGPDFAVVTKNSLLHSRKTGIYTSLGIALGISVHIAYSLLGIGLVISKSAVLFSIIKYLGAGYLVYIGYLSLRAKPQQAPQVDRQEQASGAAHSTPKPRCSSSRSSPRSSIQPLQKTSNSSLALK